jgi:hypothetical protein
MSDREEGFLSRWSRRKREAAEGRPAEPEPAPETPEAPPVPAPESPELEPPAFDPASLPPIESLTAGSDITAFLRKEVPAALRQAALRRIWTLDPAIRDYIGPADYAWDFNAPDGVPGFALSLGGDAKRLLAQAMGLLEEKEPTEEAPEPPVATESALPPEPAPVEEPPKLANSASPPLAEAPPLADTPQPAIPRRRHGGAVPS